MSSDALVVTVLVVVAVAFIFVEFIFTDTEACDQEYVPPPKAVPTHLHPPYQPVRRNEMKYLYTVKGPELTTVEMRARAAAREFFGAQKHAVRIDTVRREGIETSTMADAIATTLFFEAECVAWPITK